MNFNKVILAGRLCRDCETRFAGTGTAMVSSSVAVTDQWKNADGEYKENVLFCDVKFYGKRGETFARYHQKGSSVFLVGKLRLDRWEDKTTGQKRQKLYLVVDDWQFVGNDPGKEGFARPAAAHNVESEPSQTVDETPY